MEESGGILFAPVGFKFRASDERLVEYYLFNKISGNPIPFVDQIIRDCNLYGNEEPWQIWESFGGPNLEDDEDLYFFTQLKKKGSRIDRKVGSGAWQGEDSADDIVSSKSNTIIGSKKRFRYEKKKPPFEQHGCWIMHEYSLGSRLLPQNQQNQYVLCRIRKNDQKATAAGKKGSRKKRKFEEQVKSNMEVVEDQHRQYKRQNIIPSNLQQNQQLLMTQQRTTTSHDQIEVQPRLLLQTPSGFEENQQLPTTEHQSLQQPELSENYVRTSYSFQVNQQVPITKQILLHQPEELSQNYHHTPSDLKQNQQPSASEDNDDFLPEIYFSDDEFLSGLNLDLLSAVSNDDVGELLSGWSLDASAAVSTNEWLEFIPSNSATTSDSTQG